MECGVLVTDVGGIHDKNGCRLPSGHDGPHEFENAVDGKIYLWETYWECDCDHCMKCEGDYCITYWIK